MRSDTPATGPALVTVGWAYGQPAAAAAISALEGAGILTVPLTRQMASVCWHYAHALGGIALAVPSGQAGEARAILAAQEPPAQPPRKSWRRILLALLAFFYFGVPPPPSGLFLRGPAVVADGRPPRA